MPLIRYIGSESDGQPIDIGEIRHVIVTNEQLSALQGFEGDPITYTATVKDDSNETLPSDFQASLLINSDIIIDHQSFNAPIYHPANGTLTLQFVIPAMIGQLIIKLQWDTQDLIKN